MDHNILKSNSSYYVKQDSIVYNLIDWQALGNGTGSFNMDPMFSNISARDFSSKDGSVAIDNGLITHVYDEDLNNTPRPQGSDYDIGSYERAPGPVPVELSSFTVKVLHDIIELNWRTETEVNNYGFDVERKTQEVGSENWVKIGFVDGHGNSNSPKKYSYVDNNPVGSSKFCYRLKQIDNDGQFEYSDIVEIELLPVQYALYQNYPNPFNNSTNIKFSLPKATRVEISIYNSLGELVINLLNRELEAGYHNVEFNTNIFASGIYFYRIIANEFVQTKKMVLMK